MAKKQVSVMLSGRAVDKLSSLKTDEVTKSAIIERLILDVGSNNLSDIQEECISLISDCDSLTKQGVLEHALLMANCADNYKDVYWQTIEKAAGNVTPETRNRIKKLASILLKS